MEEVGVDANNNGSMIFKLLKYGYFGFIGLCTLSGFITGAYVKNRDMIKKFPYIYQRAGPCLSVGLRYGLFGTITGVLSPVILPVEIVIQNYRDITGKDRDGNDVVPQ